MELDTALPMANQAKRLLAALDFEWECEAASRKLLALSDFDTTRKKVLKEVSTLLWCGRACPFDVHCLRARAHPFAHAHPCAASLVAQNQGQRV